MGDSSEERKFKYVVFVRDEFDPSNGGAEVILDWSMHYNMIKGAPVKLPAEQADILLQRVKYPSYVFEEVTP